MYGTSMRGYICMGNMDRSKVRGKHAVNNQSTTTAKDPQIQYKIQMYLYRYTVQSTGGTRYKVYIRVQYHMYSADKNSLYEVLVRVRIGYDNVPVLKGLQEARPKCTVKGSGKEPSMTRSKEP